mmetsp:Transcript_30391/g.43092  ORF Transcript_30391/g.43092 Transcript_30391/m.43092 type:complete len:106 (+) Transcript_30391:879-1196(+)
MGDTASTTGHTLHPHKASSYKHQQLRQLGTYLHQIQQQNHSMSEVDSPLGLLYITEQMSIKRGLKRFGKAGTDAVVNELEQQDYQDIIEAINWCNLTQQKMLYVT